MWSAQLARMDSCKGISDDIPISATASGEGLQAHQKTLGTIQINKKIKIKIQTEMKMKMDAGIGESGEATCLYSTGTEGY